ncbi:MAG: hypothetical protein SP1CHLAM54_00810 [Chlamydiia bacterium]|nr:hypothetical protein [Chlamydiia bacterium]MCH9615003.1 hypothetical protein [Chlamydiia bacterium]MCH9629947.1 hypothetical protein [Chlamydiia bacterium]
MASTTPTAGLPSTALPVLVAPEAGTADSSADTQTAALMKKHTGASKGRNPFATPPPRITAKMMPPRTSVPYSKLRERRGQEPLTVRT